MAATWALVAVAWAAAAVRATQPVRVLLEAPWPAPPLLLEASEWFAAESAGSYWAFVEAVNEAVVVGNATAPPAAIASDRDGWELATRFARQGYEDAAVGLLQASLAAHEFAATIEAQRHFFDETVAPHLAALADDVAGCAVVAVVDDGAGGVATCDVNDGFVASLAQRTATATATAVVRQLRHDYTVGSSVVAQPDVVLYGELGTPAFALAHRRLAAAAHEGRLHYAVRHRAAAGTGAPRGHLALSGYGVEMAIKSTEYKVLDDAQVQQDANARLGADTGASEDEDAALPTHIDSPKTLRMEHLAHKAVFRIVQAADPLAMLRHLSQNLPTTAFGLAQLPSPPPAVFDAVAYAQQTQMYANGLVFVNGRIVSAADVNDINPYNLLPLLRRELWIVNELVAAGFAPAQATALVNGGADVTNVAHVIDVRTPAAVFLNDLRTDARYGQFIPHLAQIQGMYLQFQGQMLFFRFNLVTALFVLDPTDLEQVLVLGRISQYLQRAVPLRFGVLFLDPDPSVRAALAAGDDSAVAVALPGGRTGNVAVMLYRAMAATRKASGEAAVHRLLFEYGRVAQMTGAADMEALRLAVRNARAVDWEAVVAIGDTASPLDQGAEQAHADALDRGVEPGSIFVNGDAGRGGYGEARRRAQQFENTILSPYGRQIDRIRTAVSRGELHQDMDIYEFLLSRPDVFPKRNPLIFPKLDAEGREVVPPFVSLARVLALAAPADMLPPAAVDDAAVPVTHVLAGDWTEPDQLAVLETILAHQQLQGRGQLLILDTSVAAASGSDRPLSLLPQVLAVLPTVQAGLASAVAAVQRDTVRVLRAVVAAVRAEPTGYVQLSTVMASLSPPARSASALAHAVEALAPEAVAAWRTRQAQLFAALVSGNAPTADGGAGGEEVPALSASQPGPVLVTNGRVLAPVSAAAFGPVDLALWEQFEIAVRARPLLGRVTALPFPQVAPDDLTTEFYGRALAVAVSVLGPSARDRVALPSVAWSDLPLSLDLRDGAVDDAAARLLVTLLVDPLSEEAQRQSALALYLRELPGVRVVVRLIPGRELTELGVRRYYRMATSARPTFDAAGHVVPTAVTFKGLPGDLLLTLGMEVHQAWLTECTAAVHDLDNLQLSPTSDQTVHAGFRIKRLLVEGHAAETSTGWAPRGLQLVLGSAKHVHAADTLVMANLGYFQLQAAPGVWSLSIREGRSAALYGFAPSRPGHPAVGATAHPAELTRPVVLATFRGCVVRPQFTKRPGREHEQILRGEGEDDTAAPGTGSVWNSIKTAFGVGDPAAKAGSNVTINVFSVASGHLYERFLRIMFVGVLRHTKSPVKFWLIENFLSPGFKEFLPHMAEAYGFEYEYVTYKWPRWLRAQREKQRIIWAYKLLFLDVLFPLSLDKVIFVDADQIVRADLKELVEMDLHGAPYGYTPFCESRKETDGFRFWKQGWWAGQLQGRPYHISALYVVDLKRFREMAAGDQIRGQYNSLSGDPNSLANLDQDLPNHMQMAVPIFSLPQEWLWCETWCSDATLKTAKTIDLCNNPLTKEPKLSVAMRLLPEWTVYDREVRDLQERVARPIAASDAAPTGASTAPTPRPAQTGKTDL